MALNFVPPPIHNHIQWKDVFATGPEDDGYWNVVRRTQLVFVNHYLMINVVIAAVCIIAIYPVFGDLLSPLLLSALAGAHSLLVLCSWRLRSFLRSNVDGPVPRNVMFRTAAAMSGSCAVIGCIIFALLGKVDFAYGMMLIGLSMTAMGALAFTNFIWPLGSFVSWPMIAAGTIMGLLQNHWDHSWPVMVGLTALFVFAVHGTLVASRDMQKRILMQDRMSEHEDVVRLLLNEFEANGSEWLFEFDDSGRLTFASSRFGEAVRRPVASVIGQHWLRFLAQRHLPAELTNILRRQAPFRDMLVRMDIEGEIRWWSLSGTPKFDRNGQPTGYRGVGSDVTDRQRAAERIAELATFDSLTGLVNRRIIHQALGDALAIASETEASFALMFVDLDRFKQVNDSYGHGIGDKLLAEVAMRLRDHISSFAGHGALVGRLGGDEFAVVLRSATQERSEALGHGLITSLCQPYQIQGKRFVIGASVGVAMGPRDGNTVEDIMRAADLALYDVKARGRGTVRVFDRLLQDAAEERRALEMDLRQALIENQMQVLFQPVVSACDEKVVGFEALIRWEHPVYGQVSPSNFIPIAEENGLIWELGEWVLNEACRVAAGWPDHVKVAVNVSCVQVERSEFFDVVRSALERWNLRPGRLELELTESLFLHERQATMDMLRALQNLGIGFALDDFGTGYSSLGYLQKVAFRRLKIDRSFVQSSATDSGESTAIIQAIVALAERLGMETTAEGTETRIEFETMRRLGCMHIQGFLFGKPMSAKEAEDYIQDERPILERVN